MIWILLLACGPAVPENPCVDDAVELVRTDDGTLTCADARIPTRYLRLLAGAPLPAGATAVGVQAVRERFTADPVATRAWLQSIAAIGSAIEAQSGLPAAEKRSAEIWRATAGKGPITEADGELWNLLGSAVSVRARSDAEGLALTDTDIEGWIHYASLCHEVQGKGVLTVSIANRVDVYRMASERFEQGERSEMIALTALGTVWEDVRRSWQAADHPAQQAWIADAPLPDAMSASSLAYVEAVLEGDVGGHASVLHRHLGPLYFRDGPGYFGVSP